MDVILLLHVSSLFFGNCFVHLHACQEWKDIVVFVSIQERSVFTSLYFNNFLEAFVQLATPFVIVH